MKITVGPHCYVCGRKKQAILAQLGLCSVCWQSYIRSSLASTNRVAAMVWAAKRARKLAQQTIKDLKKLLAFTGKGGPKMTKNTKKKAQRGMSMLEIVISVAIVGVMTSICIYGVSQMQHGNSNLNSNVECHCP